MENSNTKNEYWSRFFIGFTVVTIISGIYLIIQKDYAIGIGGSVTGLYLLYLQKGKNTKEEIDE